MRKIVSWLFDVELAAVDYVEAGSESSESVAGGVAENYATVESHYGNIFILNAYAFYAGVVTESVLAGDNGAEEVFFYI